MKKWLTFLFTIFYFAGFSQGVTVTVGKLPAESTDTLTGTIDGSQVIGGISASNTDSLGGKPPAFYVDTVTVRTLNGLEPFFLQPRGLLGIGGGWADEGVIGNTPVVFFSANATEKSVYNFYALSRVLLTDTNPRIVFIVYSTTAPVAITSDSVRWQLDARYVAETEAATKVPDETILFTQVLPILFANRRQTALEFTLDRTLMTDQDALSFTLSRIGGDGFDKYNADIAIGQSGIIVITLNHSP